MFTDTERNEILEVVADYTNLQNMAKSLQKEIQANKDSVATLIEKLKKGEADEDTQAIIGDIMSSHYDHTQSLNNIVEEIEIVKTRETAMYQELAIKYDVEVNTIISEAVNTVLAK